MCKSTKTSGILQWNKCVNGSICILTGEVSAAKWGSANLEGEASGLFYELVRVVKDLRKVYGFTFKIYFGIGNVASMDADAEHEPLVSSPGCLIPAMQCLYPPSQILLDER